MLKKVASIHKRISERRPGDILSWWNSLSFEERKRERRLQYLRFKQSTKKGKTSVATATKKYEASPKGKDARSKYRASEKGRKTNQVYFRSEAGRSAQKKYRESSKGKATRKRNRQRKKSD